jgi:hypothetical protein
MPRYRYLLRADAIFSLENGSELLVEQGATIVFDGEALADGSIEGAPEQQQERPETSSAQDASQCRRAALARHGCSARRRKTQAASHQRAGLIVPKYKLTRDHFITPIGHAMPKHCAKGDVVDYAGPPSLFMQPLDDAARVALAEHEEQRGRAGRHWSGSRFWLCRSRKPAASNKKHAPRLWRGFRETENRSGQGLRSRA